MDFTEITQMSSNSSRKWGGPRTHEIVEIVQKEVGPGPRNSTLVFNFARYLKGSRLGTAEIEDRRS